VDGFDLGAATGISGYNLEGMGQLVYMHLAGYSDGDVQAQVQRVFVPRLDGTVEEIRRDREDGGTWSAWAVHSTATGPTGPAGPVGASDPVTFPDREQTLGRHDVTASNLARTSGTVWLGYFTASSTRSLSNMRHMSSSAPATVTLIRMGVYSVDASTGDLTLIASTPNDTALLATANAATGKALSAAASLVQGQRYALALLVVATTVGNGMGANLAHANVGSLAPRVTGSRTGQTDLPATITAANVAATASAMFVELY
jgi:hypothetical protein